MRPSSCSQISMCVTCSSAPGPGPPRVGGLGGDALLWAFLALASSDAPDASIATAPAIQAGRSTQGLLMPAASDAPDVAIPAQPSEPVSLCAGVALLRELLALMVSDAPDAAIPAAAPVPSG